MKQLVIIFLIQLIGYTTWAQNAHIDQSKIQEDLDEMIQNISDRYIYLEDKKLNIECIKDNYSAKINALRNQADVILFFENLLNEFYDSHISLNVNIQESFRLSSPLWIELRNNKAYIKNVWMSQIEHLDKHIIGAEVLEFNSIDFNQKIDAFPTLCHDKSQPEVRNWIANKIVSGKYSEPRILTLILKSGERLKFDVDQLALKKEDRLLTTKVKNGIGIIRINNSLGTYELVSDFDKALDDLFSTKGLIIDLRNTNNGGNTYVAKGIMGRFIEKELPYQKHYYSYAVNNQPKIVRSWLELVSPRGSQYKKPVILIVGRWTGSMGEGLAIGFDAMKRAEIVGTEMKRLAGSDFDFKFKHQNFGYKLILEKLFHINGTPRETFVPEHYVMQTSIKKDEAMIEALELMDKIAE